jgi:hypothetical protein
MGPVFQRLIDSWSEEVGVDIIAQTRAFAEEVGAGTAGTSMYRFTKPEASR